jgi:hypothetical protein
MPLNYNIKQVPLDIKYPVVTDEEEIAYLRKYGKEMGIDWYEEGGVVRSFSPKTQALIFGSRAIGMRAITEKNWQKFYQRLFLVSRIRGLDLPVSPQDVWSHIGLSTNAHAMTDAQFRRALLDDGFYLAQADIVNNHKED